MIKKEDLENLSKAELIEKLLSLQTEYNELSDEKLDMDIEYDWVYNRYEELFEEHNQYKEDIDNGNIICDVNWFKFILDRYNLLTDELKDFIDFYIKNVNRG